MVREFLSIMGRIDVIETPPVTEQSYDFGSDKQRCFLTSFVLD